MPRGDRTGPQGLGPMTGRAAGYCAGYPVPGYMNPIPGYGRGFGRGWGRGYGRGFGRGWGRGYGRQGVSYPPQYPYAYSQQYPYPPSQQVPPGRYINPQYAYPPIYPPTAPTQSPEQELAAIEEYKKGLEAEKTDIERVMNEVEARVKELNTKIEQGRKQPPEP
ncbi:DUF5320 family protein [Candidatus Bathyarchaeota archaeon]|nr:DUF5320 family protein [Candidatus Bathyarchaeota archaeon]